MKKVLMLLWGVVLLLVMVVMVLSPVFLFIAGYRFDMDWLIWGGSTGTFLFFVLLFWSEEKNKKYPRKWLDRYWRYSNEMLFMDRYTSKEIFKFGNVLGIFLILCFLLWIASLDLMIRRVIGYSVIWNLVLDYLHYLFIVLAFAILFLKNRKYLYVYLKRIRNLDDFLKIWKRVDDKMMVLVLKKVSRTNDYYLISRVLEFLFKNSSVWSYHIRSSQIKKANLFSAYFNLLNKDTFYDETSLVVEYRGVKVRDLNIFFLVINHLIKTLNSEEDKSYLAEEISKVLKILSSDKLLEKLDFSDRKVALFFNNILVTFLFYEEDYPVLKKYLSFKEEEKIQTEKANEQDRLLRSKKKKELFAGISAGDIMYFVSQEFDEYRDEILRDRTLLLSFAKNSRMRKKYTGLFLYTEVIGRVWWHPTLFDNLFERLCVIVKRSYDDEILQAFIKKNEEFCVFFELFKHETLTEVIRKKRENFKNALK